MMTIMVFLCIVMLYYISRLIREDPGFWGAALDKETWLKMWNLGKGPTKGKHGVTEKKA